MHEKNEQKNERTNRVTISSRKETCYWAVVIIVVVVCIGRSRKLSPSEDLPAAAAATAASEASRSVAQHIQHNPDSTSHGEKVIVPGLEVPPRGNFHPASIPRGRTVLISPMGMAGMESAISTKGGGDSSEYLGRQSVGETGRV